MSARPWWGEGVGALHPLRPPAGAPPFALRAGNTRMPSNPDVAKVCRFPGALSGQECDAILASASRQRAVRGATLEGHEDRRDCVCTWLPADGEHRWLYERVAGIFERANETFGFRIRCMVEPLMAVAYAPGHRFEWHLDAGRELASNRKLSMSLLLSPPAAYTRGRLEFASHARAMQTPPQGCALVFPSFLAHRVTPVESGLRFSLVAFAYGPTFR